MIFTVGFGLFEIPNTIAQTHTVIKATYYSYFTIGLADKMRKKIFTDIEKFYEVSTSLTQILNWMRKKFNRLSVQESRDIEKEMIDKILNRMPVYLVIEIENQYKKGKDRRQKYQKEIQYYEQVNIGVKRISDLDSIMKDKIELYQRSKVKYLRSVLDAVYYEEIDQAIHSGQECLRSHFTGFYGKNFFFKAFPELELVWFGFFYGFFQKALFLVCTALSFTIVGAELTLWARRLYWEGDNLLRFLKIDEQAGEVFWFHVILLIVGTLAAYLINASMIGYNKIRAFNNEFHEGHTSTRTLLTSAHFIVKITGPILFNLVMILLGTLHYFNDVNKNDNLRRLMLSDAFKLFPQKKSENFNIVYEGVVPC